ncbi:double-stranded RNA-binding protein 4-like isoform X2 [Gossypium australe]|uniref:Double-stranded RNA-binding protein 4-like isoform X2 n=1 Tax=Gossypium australe TaxID=47621 RepID=A0A5B6V3R5_9ROSI|nr:double-stranded RNA-binding protein 4-like isoform X2 [Gossypium australe]
MENPLAHIPQPELVDQPAAPVLASSNVVPLACPLPHSLPSMFLYGFGGLEFSKDTVFCKSILNEFVVKMNLEMPTYNTTQLGGVLPLFVSTLVFNGATYRGETGRNKKEAEQLAARVVIQSLLADDRYGTVVSEIIKSKAKLYDALNKAKDSSLDTTLAGANRLNHNNTEVENNAVTNHVPNTTHPSSRAKHLRHEFKIPKSGEGTDCIDLPIAFVPAVVGQGSGVGERSSKKQRKKKTRAKLNTNSQ